MKSLKHIIFLSVAASFTVTVSAQSLDITNGDNTPNGTEQKVSEQVAVGSQKRSAATRVRNLIKEGNKLYGEQRYAEAEVCYGKALEIDPNSDVAQYNLATSMLKTSGNSDTSDTEGPLQKAAQMFQNLIRTAENASVVEKSLYNLGNIAYNQQQYGQSIDFYKNVLRRNPDNDKARQNLRLAQLKQQQQDNQNQDQDQQQDQQNQQDQQQDKQEQQNQNQDQNQQQQQQQNQQQQQQQMSDANAEKILKAMENEEAATRKRIEAQKAKEQNSNRRTTEKPW